jgi:hypothetical protein
MMIHRFLLLAALLLLPICNAFSLRRIPRGSPMVQHIPLPTTTLMEQHMTATTTGVINGAPPPISPTLNPIQSALVKVQETFCWIDTCLVLHLCYSLTLTLSHSTYVSSLECSPLLLACASLYHSHCFHHGFYGRLESTIV